MNLKDVGLFSDVLLVEEMGLEVQVEGLFYHVCPCFGAILSFIYLIFLRFIYFRESMGKGTEEEGERESQARLPAGP